MNDIIYTIDGFDKEKTILENIMELKVEAEAISDKLDLATKDTTILTIADKLQSIIDSVTDIQAAILAKGVTITGATKLSDYDAAINTILQEPTLIAPIADNADVLSGKHYNDKSGSAQTGTMSDNTSVGNTMLWVDAQSMTIPMGYHDGTKTVYFNPEETTVTPTEASQDVTPSLTKLLTKVTVNAIPSSYKKYATGSCSLLTAMYTLNAITLSFQPTILILKAPSAERYVVAVYIGAGTSTVMQITNYSAPNMTVAFSSVSDLFTSSGVAGGKWAVEDSSYFALTGWTYYAFKT